MTEQEKKDIETPRWVELGFSIFAFAIIIAVVTGVAFVVFMSIVRFGLWLVGL